MLIFEHTRSENIVNRLVRLAGIFRYLTILFCVLIWAAGLALLANFITDGAWFIGAIAGALVGYILGLLESALLNAVMEWMAQVLVAQGEMIRKQKERK